MVETVILPKDEKTLAGVVRKHALREESRLVYRRTMWLLAWYYLNGCRRFDSFDPLTGLIQPHYLDEAGNMEFQSQDLLFNINQVAGRLSSLDLRPSVQRGDLSLPGMRDRAIGQVMLDSLVSENTLSTVKRDFAYTFTTLGSCGLCGHVVDHPTVGLTGDPEVVHPSQLFPFPSTGQDFTRTMGIMRQRYVPMAFLEERFGKQKIKSRLDEMEWYERQIGMPVGERPELNALFMGAPTIRSVADTGRERDDTMKVVMLRELWLGGPRGTCRRYVVASGETVLHDEDLGGMEAYCPIGFARFFDSGTFHGMGMFDLMFPIARQLELLLKHLFNNIRDTDQYGVIVLPHGSYNQNVLLKDVGRGLRVLPFEPDPVMENFKPFSIQPWNTGDVPGKVAAFAKQIMQSIHPIADLLQEKGRVDSASGLAFLDEQIQKTLTNPSGGVEQAFGTMYKGMLGQALREATTSVRAVPVGKLTLDLAGAVIDPSENTVSFRSNPIPDLSRLTVTVKNSRPGSAVAIKQEMVALAKEKAATFGIPDWDGLVLQALKEGIKLEVWMDEDEAAYEAVVRNCLLLYGDGQTSGEIIVTPQTSRPQLQLRVLQAFMGHPRMGMASVEVQDAFKVYRDTLIQWTGLSLPEAVPNPDDTAMLGQIEMQMQQMAGPQEGPPGMTPRPGLPSGGGRG